MGISCFYQVDLKKMVAFSSVSHITLILIALFSFEIKGK